MHSGPANGADRPLMPAVLIAGEAALWSAATSHRFLAEVKDGALPVPAFQRWLVQDYHFVQGLVRAQARVTAAAPRADWDVLAGGVVSLVRELGWFEEQAVEQAIALDAPVHPICQAYCDFLLALTYAPYAAQITGIWAVERSYLEAWRSARPGGAPFRRFVEHWTSPEFERYVLRLEQAAGVALSGASSAGRLAAVDAFRRVAGHEAEFWRLAYEGPGR